MKTYSFEDGTLGFTIIIGELLCSSCQFHLLIDSLLNPFHVQIQHIYSHGINCTSYFGFWWRPWVHIYNLSCERLCCVHLTQLPDFEDSSFYIMASIHLCNICGLVSISYDVLKYCKGASVPVYWTWNPQIWFCIGHLICICFR